MDVQVIAEYEEEAATSKYRDDESNKNDNQSHCKMTTNTV